MDLRNESVAARSDKAKLSAVVDACWVISFLASWGILIALWNTWWAPVLATLFLCHLAGLSEFVHQTVHRNLFARSPGWNRLLGRFAAAMISVDFDTYRTFHLNHHRFANTSNDPERPYYKQPGYLEMVVGWQGLSPRQKLGRIVRIARYTAIALASFGGDRPFVRVTRWAIPIAIIGSGFVEGLPWFLIPVKVIVTWYLPTFLLLFIDILFAHSEHYGTREIAGKGPRGIVPVDEQYELAWNLKFPAIIAFFLLQRHLHAEHHLRPGIHWTQARAGSRRTLLPTDYLLMWWRQGPRS